ncbi:hypothetical protein OEZ60_16045 [Defluviimonas sp. WL0024]|uniref:DUF3828 domain-containing protein n=2 Tax=Albidovulum TaxID=205889 RepID=A0ABT3J3W3_9RHOB|nr:MULTISPECIES: hypothetical protein [Defluviimonas]MCU9849513.1 hypothetical protein [Defluviimonas sp. WL0024]MCW3782079.1 hypothetical protein [Defluviimonas salinarum]
MRIVLAAALAALAALPAAARPLSPAEAQAMQKSLDTYLRSITAGNAEKIVGALPPRILNVFAGASGLETNKLESTLIEQTKDLMKGTKYRDVTANLDALDAEDAALGDGSEATWVLIPTAFTTIAGGKKTRHEQPLLAVREDDSWHFLRIDGPERQQLAAIAYPFLADKSFPPATTAAVE